MRTKPLYAKPTNNKIFLAITLAFLFLNKSILHSQVGINAYGNAPANNAMLDVSSTNKGVILPRIADASLVPNPVAGLLFYNSVSNKFNFHNGTEWLEMSTGANSWGTNGNNIYKLNTGNVGIGESNPIFPLNFSSGVGDKIALWGNSQYGTNGTSIGFGVQEGLLQIHSNQATDDIAFGYGSSANLTEQMRIKGNGSVRIHGTAEGANLPSLSIGGNGAVEVDAPYVNGGRFIVKDDGNVGIGNNNPNSTLEVNGALATKVRYVGSSLGGGVINLDNAASVYIFTVGSFDIILPAPSTCPNRRYLLVNKSHAVHLLSGYYNLDNILTSGSVIINGYPGDFFLSGSTIELISDGISRWDQIK